MPIKNRPTGKPTKPPEYDDPAGVDAPIAALEHPLQPLVEEVRGAILGVDHAITEGVMWNSPSFYFAGWFATLNLRGIRSILVVLHQGAKPRSGAPLRDSIEDGDAMLHWHSVDRDSVAFVSASDFAAKRRAFTMIVKQWVKAQGKSAPGT